MFQSFLEVNEISLFEVIIIFRPRSWRVEVHVDGKSDISTSNSEKSRILRPILVRKGKSPNGLPSIILRRADNVTPVS